MSENGKEQARGACCIQLLKETFLDIYQVKIEQIHVNYEFEKPKKRQLTWRKLKKNLHLNTLVFILQDY